MKITKKNVLISIAFIFAIFLILCSIPLFKYSNWKRDFQTNIVEENIVYQVEELPESVQTKVLEFASSYESTDYIELDVLEATQILQYTLSSSVEGITFERIYTIPQKGLWTVYVKSSIGNIQLPWIGIEIAKDNMQTATLYIQNITVGDMELPSNMQQDLVKKVNEGISNAVLLFNENLFSRRYIENVELTDESIVFKGILY